MADVAQTDIEQIPAEVETPILSVTPAALDKIRELLTSRNLTDHALRVFVAPGGCSGLQYGMTIDEAADEGDEILETDGVRVLVDSFSAMYLEEAEIDYVNSLMGGGFTVSNPNAVASCACGHSFDSGGNAGTAQGCSTGAAAAGRV